MNVALYLARRISLSAANRTGAPAVKVAVAAVTLSVAVMLTAIAVVNGFRREITAKVTGFNAHLSIFSDSDDPEDNNIVSLTPSLRTLLDNTPYIRDYSLSASVPAVFKTDSDFQGIYLRSLEGEGIRQFIAQNLTEGSMPDFKKNPESLEVMISSAIASRLGLKTGDRIDTYFITSDIRVRPLKVAGIFNSHFDTYDRVYAYVSLPLVQKMGDLRPDQGTAIVIHTDDFNRLQQYGADMQQSLMDALANGTVYKPYRVEDAYTRGAGYFNWLAMLDTNVVVILTLMTFVMIVTLISALLIIILDRKRFIGLLRALGDPASKIRSVFILLAGKITILGLAIGNVLTLILLYIQHRTHFIPLDPEAYYIDFVPVDISWQAILILNLGVIAIVWLALILPSWLVARISPAETLRYE